jgi:hypothetical protein
MKEKVMTITTKQVIEETSYYKVPLKIFNKIQQSETQEEKYKIYKELSYDDWKFIENSQDNYQETEVVDWGIYNY